MKPSDQLFRLIKSLDTSEKGYFKKFAKGYGKAQNYIVLFDIIDELDSYDEDVVIKKLRKQPFVKQLAVTKNYLFELILKSQKQYRADVSKFGKLNTLMENGEILFEKGLYEEALKTWEKAKNLAIAFDEKPFILDIETNKRRYYIDMTASNWANYAEPSYQTSFTLLAEYERMLKIQQRYVEIIQVIKIQPFFRTPEQRSTWDTFMQDPLLAPEHEPQDFYGKLYFNYIYNIYHLLCRNKDEALIYIKKIVDLWDKHQTLKDIEPIKYLSAVNNYLTNLLFLGEKDQYISYFDSIDWPSGNSISREAIIFEHYWLLKSSYYGLLNNITEAGKFFESTLPQIKKYGRYINKVRLIIMYFSIAHYYTMVGRYTDSLDYLQLLQDSKEIELRKDVQAMARLLMLINHFESGNNMLMEHLTRSTKRFLQLTNNYFETEKLFIKHLTLVLKTPDKQSKNQAFGKMLEEIDTLFASNEQEKIALEPLRINDWIKAKITNKQFGEYIESLNMDKT